MNKKDSLLLTTLYVIVFVGAIVILVPFVWLISSTFKGSQEIIKVPQPFFPKKIDFFNYYEIFKKFNMIRYFFNSVFLSATKTIIGLYLSTYCGYVLAKFNFRLKKVLFNLVLFTMMIPYLIMLIPLYDMVNKLNWIDRYIGVLIPTILPPFGIFMMRQYILSSVPNALLESARMDGANEFLIFHKIAFPLCQNMLSALGIFLFLWSWEDFLWPYLVLLTQNKFPISVALNLFSGKNVINYGPLFAATFISILPIMIVYVFLQSKFISGIAMTGIK